MHLCHFAVRNSQERCAVKPFQANPLYRSLASLYPKMYEREIIAVSIHWVMVTCYTYDVIVTMRKLSVSLCLYSPQKSSLHEANLTCLAYFYIPSLRWLPLGFFFERMLKYFYFVWLTFLGLKYKSCLSR